MLDPTVQQRALLTRKQFFGRAATGIGSLALSALLSQSSKAVGAPRTNTVGGIEGLPHHPPKAKRVIYLFMNGGPTHVDLFDYKPAIGKIHGTPVPEIFSRGQTLQHHDRKSNGKTNVGSRRAISPARRICGMGERPDAFTRRALPTNCASSRACIRKR